MTAAVILTNRETRARVKHWIDIAPDNTRVLLKKPARTLRQNELLHAWLTEIARHVEWAGKRRNVEAWKDIFTAALRSAKHGLDVVPGLNGGFVLLGMHTSQMSREECGELIDLIAAFAAEHGVVLEREAA